MQKITKSIMISATPYKVWNTIVDSELYKKWTIAFGNGSYYIGNWKEGSNMQFLGVDPKNGQIGGMYSEMVKFQPFEYISIKHIGEVYNSQIDTESESVKAWTPIYENYTFKDLGNIQTEFSIEMDSQDKWLEMFEKMWTDGLVLIKQIAETTTESIVVSSTIKASIGQVWSKYNNPKDIMEWNRASPDWYSPMAVNDLKVGGKFNYTMAARDGSAEFDFEGIFLNFDEPKEGKAFIKYAMLDGRLAEVEFTELSGQTQLKTTFDPEHENSIELQQAGWQAISDSFKTWCEK